MLDTIPGEITHEEKKLKIVWKDGKVCEYDLLFLRKQCPCAVCRGGHGANVTRTTEGIREIALQSWKKVGRYALQFVWSDNHDSGIYTLDWLRESCDAKALQD